MSKFKEMKIRIVMRAEKVTRERALEIISARNRKSKSTRTVKRQVSDFTSKGDVLDKSGRITAKEFFGNFDDDALLDDDIEGFDF